MRDKPRQFSNTDRAARLAVAQSTAYDLIIIGGGITGAGTALDAALRGMKVLLLEKNDFASGTSSKSTKLIHGGLRYLKQLEFGLVRETGLERAVAHNNACHLVHPKNMVLPIVKKGTFSALSAGIAISIYDMLAKVTDKQRRQKLSKQEIEKLEPLLRKELLKSGIVYSEYRTDDARLTIELIKAAVRNGAEAINYLTVKDFSYNDVKVSGVVCNDAVSGKDMCFSAANIVNAAGPWVDELRKTDNTKASSNMQLSKGVHIVLSKKTLNLKNAVYFDAFDGRMIFAIPRGKSVYVGTTDTFYHDDKDDLRCTREDAEYLLKAIRGMFDIPTLELKDIQSTWSGLRPLIKKQGRGPTELSRKDEIFVSDSGLITIAGGKLTGFRKMAERVIDLVIEKSGTDPISCKTEDYKIHHNPFKDYGHYLVALEKLQADFLDLDKDTLLHLLSSYGKDAFLILDTAYNTHDGNLVKSQVLYTIEYESVLTPMDFIERRTGWLYFDIASAQKYLEEVIDYFAEYFSHDNQWRQSSLTDCKALMAIHTLEHIKENVVSL